MAYGFGATLGTSSDVATFPTSIATPGGSITYHARVNVHGNGVNTSPRVWQWGNTATDGANKPSVLYYYEGDGKLWFKSCTTGTAGEWSLPVVSLDTWYDVVITQSGISTPVAYYNGVSQTVTLSTTPTGTAVTTTGLPINIGNAPANDRDFNGMIAEVAVWSGVILDAAQIASLAAGMSPLCIPQNLTFYAPLIRDAVNLLENTAPTVTGALAQPHPRVYYTDQNTFPGKPPTAAAAAPVAKLLQVNQARVRAAYW